MIKLKPATTVLAYEPGDDLSIRRDAFIALAEAYFAEMERKFL